MECGDAVPSARFKRYGRYFLCGVDGCDTFLLAVKKSARKHMKNVHDDTALVDEFVSWLATSPSDHSWLSPCAGLQPPISGVRVQTGGNQCGCGKVFKTPGGFNKHRRKTHCAANSRSSCSYQAFPCGLVAVTSTGGW